MKKLLFIICLSLFANLFLNAQTNLIENTGNVGIGTLNPNHELTVEGTSSPNIELKNSNYSNGGFVLNRTNYGHQWKWWAQSNVMYFDFSTDETNYSNKFSIRSNGNVGIGTAIPQNTLDVNGNIAFKRDSEIRIMAFSGGGNSSQTHAIIKNGWRYNQDYTSIHAAGLTTNTESSIVIKGDGNVGIGTTNPDSKLTIKGNIHTNEVKVDLLGAVAPDYVFYKDYYLKSLQEVENYISENGHLPNIPSAKNMEKDGIKLKEMNLKLLEKIEELTLYTINQEKELIKIAEEKEKALQTQKIINKNLEEKLKAQDARLQKMEAILNSVKQ